LKAAAIEFPRMLYLNKFYWEIALLCLLISDAADVKEFIKNTLGITSVEEILFTKTNPPKANSTIKSFVDSLQSSYTLETFKQQFNNDPDLFLKLYLAFTNKDNKLISKVIVKFNKGLLVSHLSEGQKKQLLVKAALEFAGQEDSLFLFDEPDSHVHISNKNSIYKIISNPAYTQSRHIIITSHSPTLTKLFPSESIILLENGAKKELANSFEASKYLVNDKDIYRLLFTDKNILIVEGKTDDLYISKAIEHFTVDYPDLSFEYLRVGGTDEENIKHLLDKIKINTQRKIIIVVDRDEAGYKVYRKLFPVIPPKKKHKDKKDVSIEKYAPNTYYLMIPHKNVDKQDGEFLVEDYFKKIKVVELSKKLIDEKFIENVPCKNFPKISEMLKTEALPQHCNESVPADMMDFKVLLEKLNEIVLKPSDI
jgi:ABC-type multidrug transport system ATPase subunit